MAIQTPSGLPTRHDPTYTSWRCMVQRVTNPNHVWYGQYGGRGISIHPALREFTSFVRHVGPRPAGHTLDRIDPDGNYEPGNDRWADAVTQRHNQRRMAQKGV